MSLSARPLRKSKKEDRGPFEGVCSSWAAWMVTHFHRTLISCPNQLNHLIHRLASSLFLHSFLLSSPLLCSPSLSLHSFALAACFVFVSTISSDSLSSWIFRGLVEGVRESNELAITLIGILRDHSNLCSRHRGWHSGLIWTPSIGDMMATCLGEVRRIHFRDRRRSR